jgi:hypothetical protein
MLSGKQIQNSVVNNKRFYNIRLISLYHCEVKSSMPFSLRVKINQNEVEISGTQKEVLKTIKDLPKLIENLSKAFANIDSTAVTTKKTPITVKLTSPTTAPSKMYPSIKKAKNCSQAVLKLLETDWGAWRPRTMPEIVEALKANAIHYPSTTLSGVLSWLVKKGKVRRWKTDAGYVYILAEKEET